MEIKAKLTDSIVVLELAGAIDINAANLVETIGQCLRDGYLDVLCDFEEVETIDYMGISVIAIAYREVVNNNGRIRFAAIPAHLKTFFSLTGLDQTIEIYATQDLAVNSFKEDKVIENIKRMRLRRRFKRLPLDIKVDIRPKDGKGGECLSVEILNLSAIGAYIFECAKFKLGDEIILKFKIPSKGEEMELEAKVVWLCDKHVQPQLYPGMGVEFRNISGPAQEKLLEFIEKNLSSLI